MSDTQKKQLLDRIVSDLKKFNPEKIILFGSQVEGVAHEDSDYDLFVVSESDKPMHERAVAMRLALKEYDVPIDVVALTPEELRERQVARDAFVADILLNGRILYAK